MLKQKGKIIDVLSEKAKNDLILIPRNWRIIADMVMGCAWFAGAVIYPIIKCTISGIWNLEFVGFICFGIFISGLFFFFAFIKIKDKKQK